MTNEHRTQGNKSAKRNVDMGRRSLLARSTAALAFSLAFAGAAFSADIPQTTFDGLELRDKTKADAVWDRPGFDMAAYDAIVYENLGLAHKPVRRTSKTEFTLTDRQNAALVEALDTAMKQELGKSERFEWAESSGESTLRLSVALLDVVSHVPDEPIGRGAIYISSVGEATLVLELRDSTTGAILARAADRADASPPRFTESSRMNNLREVRQAAGQWARLLRKRLDSF